MRVCYNKAKMGQAAESRSLELVNYSPEGLAGQALPLQFACDRLLL